MRLRASRREHGRFFGGALARDNFDWALFLTAAALAVCGVVNLYSATSVSRAALSEIYIQQVYWLVLGGILGAVVAVIDYRHYERLGYVLYGVGILSLVLVFILGKDIRGSSRWIQIGSFGFQPSEFMKLFLIIALAKYLHDDPRTEDRTLRDLVGPALIAIVPVFLVLKQPDLGTALILLLIFATICLLTKIRWQSLVSLVVTSAILAPLLWTYVLKDYQKQRILVFLNPRRTSLDRAGTRTMRASRSAPAAGRAKGSCAGRRTSTCSFPISTPTSRSRSSRKTGVSRAASCWLHSTCSWCCGRFGSLRRRRTDSARFSRSGSARSSSGTRSSISAW